ncbi:hypothetical protein NQ315_009133 [Exocentrus adspersus]|uniref:E3 ubiquitin-protein ligase n=1 Tax=Exocentrus adspersus TaxID=1586481 RepID=A0AAV8WFU8_9CUCU|nr:hypothetical protein NQ315_009133 [Exocentrus adspersus]
MENTCYTDLLLELECPICTNYMAPPISQCATGHSICEECRGKLSNCALCKGVFTESRNIALERLAVKVRYPCINKNSGCNLKLAYNERRLHESNCAFKGYRCAMENCFWIGRLEDIPLHWISKENITKPCGTNNFCRTKMISGSYYVNLVIAFDKLFWFKCKLSNKKVYWAVQYIGNSTEAENYYYELDIFKSNRTKNKILISNYCQPVDIEDSLIFSDACISLPLNMVTPFLCNDQTLEYHMRVNTVNKKSEQCKAISGTKKQEKSKKVVGPKEVGPNKK